MRGDCMGCLGPHQLLCDVLHHVLWQRLVVLQHLKQLALGKLCGWN